MARPAIPKITRILRDIIALSPEELEELENSISIMKEIREEIASRMALVIEATDAK